MSPFSPVTRGGRGGNYTGDMPVTGGGGGVKNSQFCGDIIFEWPLSRSIDRMAVTVTVNKIK